MNHKETLSDSRLSQLLVETEAFLSQIDTADFFNINKEEVDQLGQGTRDLIRLHLMLLGTQGEVLQLYDQEQK